MYGIEEGALRVPGKALLEQSGERVGCCREQVIWPREGVNIIPDAIVRPPFHGKKLFTSLCMTW